MISMDRFVSVMQALTLYEWFRDLKPSVTFYHSSDYIQLNLERKAVNPQQFKDICLMFGEHNNGVWSLPVLGTDNFKWLQGQATVQSAIVKLDLNGAFVCKEVEVEEEHDQVVELTESRKAILEEEVTRIQRQLEDGTRIEHIPRKVIKYECKPVETPRE